MRCFGSDLPVKVFCGLAAHTVCRRCYTAAERVCSLCKYLFGGICETNPPSNAFFKGTTPPPKTEKTPKKDKTQAVQMATGEAEGYMWVLSLCASCAAAGTSPTALPTVESCCLWPVWMPVASCSATPVCSRCSSEPNPARIIRRGRPIHVPRVSSAASWYQLGCCSPVRKVVRARTPT